MRHNSFIISIFFQISIKPCSRALGSCNAFGCVARLFFYSDFHGVFKGFFGVFFPPASISCEYAALSAFVGAPFLARRSTLRRVCRHSFDSPGRSERLAKYCQIVGVFRQFLLADYVIRRIVAVVKLHCRFVRVLV